MTLFQQKVILPLSNVHVTIIEISFWRLIHVESHCF